jgi:hypothetical protein
VVGGARRRRLGGAPARGTGGGAGGSAAGLGRDQVPVAALGPTRAGRRSLAGPTTRSLGRFRRPARRPAGRGLHRRVRPPVPVRSLPTRSRRRPARPSGSGLDPCCAVRPPGSAGIPHRARRPPGSGIGSRRTSRPTGACFGPVRGDRTRGFRLTCRVARQPRRHVLRRRIGWPDRLQVRPCQPSQPPGGASTRVARVAHRSIRPPGSGCDSLGSPVRGLCRSWSGRLPRRRPSFALDPTRRVGTEPARRPRRRGSLHPGVATSRRRPRWAAARIRSWILGRRRSFTQGRVPGTRGSVHRNGGPVPGNRGRVDGSRGSVYGT